MNTMTSSNSLVNEIMSTGTLTGLPSGHFIEGRYSSSVSGRVMEIFDPGRGRAFAAFQDAAQWGRLCDPWFH